MPLVRSDSEIILWFGAINNDFEQLSSGFAIDINWQRAVSVLHFTVTVVDAIIYYIFW